MSLSKSYLYSHDGGLFLWWPYIATVAPTKAGRMEQRKLALSHEHQFTSNYLGLQPSHGTGVFPREVQLDYYVYAAFQCHT